MGIHMRQAFSTLLIFAAACAGQEFRATISGRVTDTQNSVVPAVRIMVVQIGTEARFQTVSDHDGLYVLPFLPPATSRRRGESAGSNRYARDNLAAAPNDRIGGPFQLERGEVKE